MTHTTESLMALVDAYAEEKQISVRFSGSGFATTMSAQIEVINKRESLRAALTEALAFRPDWADFENGRECGKLEAAQPVREPLTDEQIYSIVRNGLKCFPLPYDIRLTREIERAHGIGGYK